METLTLLRLLAAYVVLTTVARLTGSQALDPLVNAFGVAMPLTMFVYFKVCGTRVQVPFALLVGYGVLAAALAMSALIVGLSSVADLTKFLLVPLFAMLGYSATAFERNDKVLIHQLRIVGFVLLLPVAYALVLNLHAETGDMLGIFANRNNAALYLVVLGNVLFLLGASVWAVVLALSVGALMFSTLGVVMAVGLALFISLSFKRYLPAYLAAAALGAFLLFGPIELPVGERLEQLGASVQAITSAGLWTELAHLSYGDLYLLTGENTDLSLFFRLKHWEDLWVAWTSQGWVSMFFGLGIGAAPFHTELGLVPHNDYLRFLIESGPLGFVGFVSINVWLLWSIGRNARLMSTAAVAIYFFTENLVDNFASMTLYYWFAGYWARYAVQGSDIGEPMSQASAVIQGLNADALAAPAGRSSQK